MPRWFTPNIFQEYSGIKAWGCPRHPLLHQQTIRSFLVQLYFNFVTCYALILKRLFVFCFFYYHSLNNMDPSIILCGRDTRSAFSYEYSYSSLIFVQYSFHVIVCFLALVFHASLSWVVSFVMPYSHCLITWRVYPVNKLIGVWLETENAKCGRWYN